MAGAAGCPSPRTRRTNSLAHGNNGHSDVDKRATRGGEGRGNRVHPTGERKCHHIRRGVLGRPDLVLHRSPLYPHQHIDPWHDMDGLWDGWRLRARRGMYGAGGGGGAETTYVWDAPNKDWLPRGSTWGGSITSIVVGGVVCVIDRDVRHRRCAGRPFEVRRIHRDRPNIFFADWSLVLPGA